MLSVGNRIGLNKVVSNLSCVPILLYAALNQFRIAWNNSH